MPGRNPIPMFLVGVAVTTFAFGVGGAAAWLSSWPWLWIASLAGLGAAAVSTLLGAVLGAAIARRRVVGIPAFELATPEPPLRLSEQPTNVDPEPLPPDPIPDLVRALHALDDPRSAQRVAESLPEELTEALVGAAQRWRDDRQSASERIEQLRVDAAQQAAEHKDLVVVVEQLTDELGSSAQGRDAFLSRMSHELRTPLNAILGYAEMLEEDLEDEDLRSDASRIRSSAANLLGTITAVLDLTQLQSGEYAVVPQAIDLTEMAREIGRAVLTEARTNRNQLEVRARPGIVATLDRRMMHSILLNLLSNACKYTWDGMVKLVIDEAQDRLRIVVADTGIGMTQRQIEAALTPFAQGDASTTRRYDGSGLGLSVVHGFVEAMGGSLRIQSQPGRGASVEVDLPNTCERHDPATGPLHPLDDQPTMLAR